MLAHKVGAASILLFLTVTISLCQKDPVEMYDGGLLHCHIALILDHSFITVVLH